MTKTSKNIVVIGSEGVGKSSLCIRYAQGNFPKDHLPTQVVDTYQKWVPLNNKTTRNAFGSSTKQIKLSIIDTAGQEEMVCLLDKHLEKADSVMIVLSLSDCKSLDRASSLYERSLCKFSKEEGRLQPIIIVCNKSDLQETDPGSIKFNIEDIKAKLKGVNEKQIILASALNDSNVKEAFDRAIELMGKQKKRKCNMM